MILSRKLGAERAALTGLQVGAAVLVAHGRRRHPDRPVIERADERVDLGAQARARELLGKPQSSRPPAIGGWSLRNMQWV